MGVWIWFYSRGSAGCRCLRILAAVLLSLALAQPVCRSGRPPVNLVILVDRSPSMPPDMLLRLREWLGGAILKPQPQDGVALVGFASEARIEMRTQGKWPGFVDWRQTVGTERTDMGGALDVAASLLEGKTGGRVLLISDGMDQGGKVGAALSRLESMGAAVHTRFAGREGRVDVAVLELGGPAKVRPGQPFVLSAQLWASGRAKVRYRLFRGKTPVAQGEKEAGAGLNNWRFRDVLAQPRLEEYRLEIETPGELFSENNSGICLVKVTGGRRLALWKSHSGESLLARDLASLGFEVETREASQPPRSVAELSGVRGAVLEDVSATALGAAGMEALRLHVERLGGFLLITGGKSSFGLGGYCQSALETLLPVSLEVRKEQRKAAVSICVVMDRSGSMDMEVMPGVKKIQLANEGVVAALRLLMPNDAVAVIAVDSAAHRVVPLQPVKNLSELASQVRRIESMGGGIFVRTGLMAAMRELENAPSRTRHVILFADASDSEEQEGTPELIQRFKNMGITVSVIGLGTRRDRDAVFLDGLAGLSGGQIEFTDNPRSLPQLFAKETISILRSTFVETPVDVVMGPDLPRLGPVGAAAWPRPKGHNVTYLKPGAGLGLTARDEQESPLLAFWPRERGRVAALALPWEGEFAGEWPQWNGRAGFLGQLMGWLDAGCESDAAELRWVHAGERVQLHLTLDGESGVRAPAPGKLTVMGPDGESRPLWRFHEERPGEWVTVPELSRPGHYLAVYELNAKEYAVSPPLSVSHPPEFDFQHCRGGAGGQAVLRELRERTGGTSPARLNELLEERPVERAVAPLIWPWLLAAMLVYLFEIAAERLGWMRTMENGLARVAEGWRRKRFSPEKGGGPSNSSTPPPPPSENLPPPPPAGSSGGDEFQVSPMVEAKARARRAQGKID